MATSNDFGKGKSRPSRLLRLALLALFFLGIGANSHAETIMLKPQGEYASIDTRLAVKTMRDLAQGTDAVRAQTVREVVAAPQNYAPPVFYVLSSLLFKAGLKDDAVFWFYAGQLRARFDANRCNDASARSAVSALNEQYGAPINEYAFQDTDKLLTQVEKVVAWDRATPHEYDQRWINLSGMGATTSAMGEAGQATPLSLPEAQWEAIAEKTRADYLAGLREVLGKAE